MEKEKMREKEKGRFSKILSRRILLICHVHIQIVENLETILYKCKKYAYKYNLTL